MSKLLASLRMSPERVAARRETLGGSDMNAILSGKDDRVLRLWREKRGEAEPEDLSGNLAVTMGLYTEPLNAAWFEANTGLRVTRVGERVERPGLGFPATATLDGVVTDNAGAELGVFEAKHCGTRDADADLFARYVPQLAYNAHIAGLGRAWLSILRGNGDWLMYEYAQDGDYLASVLDAGRAFWACVRSDEPPVPLPPPPPPKPVGVREYDMAGSNSWAVHVGAYLDTMLAADRHEVAKRELKALVPDDASMCFGAGLSIKRTKAGALRFAVTGDSQ